MWCRSGRPASLLVGYLTVNVARQVQETPSARIRSEGDLRGLRVAVRSGTVSESLLRDLNAASSGPKGHDRAAGQHPLSH